MSTRALRAMEPYINAIVKENKSPSSLVDLFLEGADLDDFSSEHGIDDKTPQIGDEFVQDVPSEKEGTVEMVKEDGHWFVREFDEDGNVTNETDFGMDSAAAYKDCMSKSKFFANVTLPDDMD